MNMTPSEYSSETREHALRLLAIFKSGGAENTIALPDLEQLIRIGFVNPAHLGAGGTATVDSHRDVVLAMDYLINGGDPEGTCVPVASGMTAKLIGSIPDLEPDKPWNPAHEELEPFSDRVYVHKLLDFAACFGKDSDIFDALYYLRGNLGLNAKEGKTPLLKYFVPILASAQRDRRLEETWKAMLNKEHTCFNGYTKISPYSGFEGLYRMPPLNGDVYGMPADVLPGAIRALVMAVEREPPYHKKQGEDITARDKAARFKQKLEGLYETFPAEGLVPVVQAIFDDAPATWPAWAQELAHEIAEGGYVPLSEGGRDDYGFSL